MQTHATTRSKKQQGFTLVEAIVSLLIAGISIAALVAGFIWVPTQAESAAYAVSANALAVQGYEQARAARWDALQDPPLDDLVTTNFLPRGMIMDMVKSGTNHVWATNYTSITTISTNPLVKLVRVDCVYPFQSRRVTNTVVGYRAPECGQQNSVASTAPVSPTLPPTGGTTTNSNARTGAVTTAPGAGAVTNVVSGNNNNNNNNGWDDDDDDDDNGGYNNYNYNWNNYRRRR